MSTPDLYVQMGITQWKLQTGRATALIDKLSDEQLSKEIAPGKNRGSYIIGHLIAVHDAMNTILGTGERQFARLDDTYLKNPDRLGEEEISLPLLRQYWQQVHQQLASAFGNLVPEEWFKRHNAMTEEDFTNDPGRNKLSVLLNRAGHLAYHLGQLQLLK